MQTGSLGVVSNREDWVQAIEITDAETGDPIDLTDATVTMQVRRSEDYTPDLTATVDNDLLTVTEDGILTWNFLVGSMRNLERGTYEVGITILRDGATDQLFVGTVSIIDGIVS